VIIAVCVSSRMPQNQAVFGSQNYGKSYVTKPEDDGYRLTGSRVSLDSIVYDWSNGKPWVRIASSVQA
jgi:hypothetical protein